MALLLYLLILLSPGLSYNEVERKFLQDFFSYESIHSIDFNVIVCDENESIKVIKILSESFQRYVGVHSADEILRANSDEPQTFILSLRCFQSKEILQQAGNEELFKKPNKWILLAQQKENLNNINSSLTINGNIGEPGDWYWKFLETQNLLVDSDVKVVEGSHEDIITVTGAYKVGKTRDIMKEALAEWTITDGLVVLNSECAAIRRLNLHGVVIPTSMVLTHEDSKNHIEDMIDRHIDTTSKVGYAWVKLIALMSNSRLEFKLSDIWGNIINGTATGMLGDFQRGNTEVGASPLFFSDQRLKLVEYYAHISTSGGPLLNFIFLSPPLSYSSNIFVLPFDTIVWYCCISMVGVSCFLLYVALKLESTGFHKNENGKFVESNQFISFTEILVLNIGAICCQGTAAKVRGPAGRIITLFLYSWYMFLYISYSAAIVAILQSSDTSISTLADLLRSPFEAGVEDIAYSRFYFTTADDPVRKGIYEKKIAPKGQVPHFLTPEEGIKKVRNGLYAFHMETNVGYQMIQKTFTEKEKCSLQELKTPFIKAVEPWLVMRKGTPYSEIFKIGMKRVSERGFKSRTIRRFYTKKPTCTAKVSRYVSVGVADCYYAYMLFSCGIFVSFTIMIVEVAFHKVMKRRSKLKKDENPFVPVYEFIN